jgi:large subunit ribosomal protein L1
MKRSKNYNNAKALIDGNKKYSPLEACELAKKTTTVKYDATIRVSFKLNVDPRQADQQIRGAIVLPNGTGRSQKVLVVTQGANMEVAKNAGADYVGDKEILDKIKGGWFDYDVIVATPDMTHI